MAEELDVAQPVAACSAPGLHSHDPDIQSSDELAAQELLLPFFVLPFQRSNQHRFQTLPRETWLDSDREVPLELGIQHKG